MYDVHLSPAFNSVVYITRSKIVGSYVNYTFYFFFKLKKYFIYLFGALGLTYVMWDLSCGSETPQLCCMGSRAQGFLSLRRTGLIAWWHVES